MSLRAATLRMAIEISHRILPKMACHGQGVCDLLGGHPADPWNARSCAGLPNRDVLEGKRTERGRPQHRRP
jgi:hypothetical protein